MLICLSFGSTAGQLFIRFLRSRPERIVSRHCRGRWTSVGRHPDLIGSLVSTYLRGPLAELCGAGGRREFFLRRCPVATEFGLSGSFWTGSCVLDSIFNANRFTLSGPISFRGRAVAVFYIRRHHDNVPEPATFALSTTAHRVRTWPTAHDDVEHRLKTTSRRPNRIFLVWGWVGEGEQVLPRAAGSASVVTDQRFLPALSGRGDYADHHTWRCSTSCTHIRLSVSVVSTHTLTHILAMNDGERDMEPRERARTRSAAAHTATLHRESVLQGVCSDWLEGKSRSKK